MKQKVLITGAAGLVGQNLIPMLKQEGLYEIVAVDKHQTNCEILRRLHPDVTVLVEDIAEPGKWEEHANGCQAIIQLHAQIGGIQEAEFERNNIIATENVLKAADAGSCEYIVHISSSVVNSQAVDFYTETKKQQEAVVSQTKIPHIILRPTLMFGWFDRKHLGWLKRFMQKTPLFPVPGSGKYLRQPLYAGDFARIVHSSLINRFTGTFDISGLEKIDYIDIIREIKSVTNVRSTIVRIPYWAFWVLLKTYSVFDRDPPFTTKQLAALVTPDVFPVIDWPTIFNVEPTPLSAALSETFNHREYSRVELDF